MVTGQVCQQEVNDGQIAPWQTGAAFSVGR